MATRSGLNKWRPEFFDKYETFTVFDLLKEYIASGRVKLDKSKNPVKACYHDPCNYGRKSQEAFGHGYFEEPRWIMDQCMSEWVDLFPSKETQYCCGGGGGTLLTPYVDERMHYARRKMDQIRHAGVNLVVLPCHSCHGQIQAMARHFGYELEVRYLWEMVANALVLDA